MADKLYPVCKKRKDIEPIVVRIIQEGSNKAHCRTHDKYGTADDCFFCLFFITFLYDLQIIFRY